MNQNLNFHQYQKILIQHAQYLVLEVLIEKLFFIYAEKPIQIGAFQTLNNIKKLYME